MAIYLFDNDQKPIKVIPFNNVIDVWQEMEIKDDGSLLNDVLTTTIKNDEEVIEAGYMAVREYEGNKQSFDMYEIRKSDTGRTTTFTGVPLGVSELSGYVVEDIRPQDRDVGYIARQLLADTDWEVRHVDEGIGNITTNFYYMSAKDAFNKLQTFGCEVRFKVEISGNKITAKFVDIYKRMGDRTGQRFTYGSNALTVEREVSRADTFTALIGRGKGEEIVDESGESTGRYGRKINFADVEWRKDQGKPVTKPIGQKYVEIPEATEIYGIRTYTGKRARVGLIEFSEEEDPETLLQLTYNKLVEIARPQVQFKATVANVGNYNIGDTVTIHRYDLNLHYEARIFKVKRNRKNNKLTELSIGDKVVKSTTDRQSEINSALKGIEEVQTQIKEDINYVVINGKGIKFTYGNTEPATKKTGDHWYRDHPSKAGETQLLIWDGTAWVISSDSSLAKDASNLQYGVIDAGGNLSIINLSVNSLVGGTIDLAKGIKIGDGDKPVMEVGADGKVRVNADEISIGLKRVVTEDELDQIEGGLSAYLESDATLIEKNKDGINYDGAENVMKLSEGSTEVTDEWTFTITPSSNVTGTVINPKGNGYKITGITGKKGTVTFVAEKGTDRFRKTWNITVVENPDLYTTIKDTRNANYAPSFYLSNYKDQTVKEQKLNTTIGADTQSSIGVSETVATSEGITQTFTAGNEIYVRYGDSATDTWSEWEEIETATKANDRITDLEQRTTEYADEVSDIAKADANRHTDEVTGNIQTILDQAVNDIVEITGDIQATNELLDIRFSKSGGSNRIKNSVGYSELEFWQGTGRVGTIQNRELETVGAGSAFVFAQNSSISQTVSVEPDAWTVSVRVNKPKAGAGYVEITHDGIVDLISIDANVEYNYDVLYLPFDLVGNEVTIKIGTTAGTEMTVTSIMMNSGTLPRSWSFAKDEIYGSGFRFNENGLRVYQIEGRQYTQMTPEEFAGYAMVGGEWQRVFALNEDTTEVAKLLAREEIGMGKLAIVNIETDKNSGWAFIRR